MGSSYHDMRAPHPDRAGASPHARGYARCPTRSEKGETVEDAESREEGAQMEVGGQALTTTPSEGWGTAQLAYFANWGVLDCDIETQCLKMPRKAAEYPDSSVARGWCVPCFGFQSSAPRHSLCALSAPAVEGDGHNR
jgi:hypothetical protein